MTACPPRAANIERVYRQASAAQREQGTRWYRDAHGAAASLDPDNPERAAGVIAALSPQTNWPRNLELAARAYREGHASGTLPLSCGRADAILAGADPLDVLGGPKTRAFYQLIVSPDDPDTVCVDRHAIDVAIGERLSTFDRDRWYPLDRRGLYRRFADCYRQAAGDLGITPAQCQATTWCAWRDRYADVRVAA